MNARDISKQTAILLGLSLITVILTSGSCGTTTQPPTTNTEIEYLKEQNNKSDIQTGDTIVLDWKVNNLPTNGKCFLNIDPQGDEPLTRSEVTCEGSSPQTPSKTTNYTLQANAQQGNFVSDSLLITVQDNTEPTNQAPIANNDEYFAIQGQSIKINSLEGVLANDSDPEGKPLTASVQNQPTQGTLNLNNDGSFTYNHNGSSNNDSFTYQASDGQITTTAKATINIIENTHQSFPINNSTNDAEEYLGGDNDGNILLNSTDLNFGEGGWVGLRFENITIPADATIVQAYVQFATNDTITAKTSIGSPKITIYLEDTLNPAAFTETPFNISSRPKTNTDEWFPPVWSVAGQQGSSQQADVTQSIKTALNKLGWQSGNAIVLIFTSFDGERIAETFDGVPDKSAELRVIIR